jgi:2-polyprenyl-3-methyl-5-hydroxy-6-metoxy-1,4-benzoquinol methylase
VRNQLRKAKKAVKKTLMLGKSFTNNVRYRRKSMRQGEDIALQEKEQYVFSERDLEFYRVRPIYQFLREQMHGHYDPIKRYIDIGCNVGQECFLFAEDYPDVQVDGVDFNEEAIAVAKERFPRENLDFHALNTLEPAFVEAFADAEPDLISCFEVIEHLSKRQMEILFDNISAIMTDQTVLLISTPNGHYADDGHHHVQFFSMKQLERILGKHFQVGRMGKFRYNPRMKKTHDILFAIVHKKSA